MTRPLILFGAFDRHNLGDLLLVHIAAALLPGRELIFAGLAARDLRAHGGHAVRALSEVRAALGTQPVDLLHVGGEILTTTAWQAAVMLLPPEEVQATLAYLQPQEQTAWVQAMTGSAGQAPYVADRTHWPALQRVLYAGVGGMQLAQSEPALRTEVLAKLRTADAVGVRDVQTQRTLQAAGIAAALLPDPAVMVAELFGERITQHGAQGEVAPLRLAFPHGYLAVQCSAEFGDDATLEALAAQLKQVATTSGLGLLLLRAGAAPWHDDLSVLQRLAARLPPAAVRVAESLNVWDICALIAHSRGYCGSSLHGRIVAMAYALPRINLRPPAAPQQAAKQAAFAATWDEVNVPATVDVQQLAGTMQQALVLPASVLQDMADRLVTQYRRGFEALRSPLT
ncbi:MAG: chromosome condensation regulator RCC1 [Curvibacter sp. PD_MW3]|nr:MAG: chromosome condensation regulator RCC1 [Curvibacter sp. PD_MW3]